MVEFLLARSGLLPIVKQKAELKSIYPHVATMAEPALTEVDHEVGDGTQRGIDAAIATFRDRGAEINEVRLWPLAEWPACGTLIPITERASACGEWARTRLGDWSERARRRRLGALIACAALR